MATLVEWFPPGAGAATVTFSTGTTAPYRLLALVGLEPVDVEAVIIKSPNQPGATAVDVVVPPRVITLSGLMQAASAAALWDIRTTLSRSMAQQPTRLGETYALGRLRVTIDGRQPLEVDCMVRSNEIGRPKGVKSIAPFDIEFLAPYPYWKATQDSQVLFSAAGGFTFAITQPMSMPSNNVEVDIDNTGDVDAPILAKLFGDITTARLINVTTGETLEITGNLPSTKYWEVSTAFGDKRVDEVTVATGARVTAMSKINLAKPDFWALRPGLNTVKFEADVNTSGRAELYWRRRQSGF